MRISRHFAALTAAPVVLIGLAFTAGSASAAAHSGPPITAPVSIPQSAPPASVGCVQGHRTLEWVFENMTSFNKSGGCARNGGGFEVSLVGKPGPQGPKGAQGVQGQKGDQGPSGVQAVSGQSYTETDGIVTGGSFLSRSTQIGDTFDLAAGTYEVCINAKVEQPTAASGGVSAQLFLYDQAKNSNFTGNVLNVSADTQGGTSHDAYLNGCTIDTETGAATMYLYGFGYDTDNGSGAYNLMGATVKVVQLTPAS